MPRAVDEKYFKDTGANGLYATMYYGHNLQFESAAAMFAGNLAQARAAAQRTVKLADPIADQMVMIEPFAAQELIVLVRFGQWPADSRTEGAPGYARVADRALSLRARRGAGGDRQGHRSGSRSCGVEGCGGQAADRRDGGTRQFRGPGRRGRDRRSERARRRGAGRHRRRDQRFHGGGCRSKTNSATTSRPTG